MKVNEWLQAAESQLHAAAILTARLDALILLEDCLKQDRAYLLAHPELLVTTAELDVLNMQIKRRVEHEPLAYIRNRTEFYGREFYIDEHVLEPRPESETMIELLKNLPSIHTVADIGTGSGALAITAKLELPESSVVAIDIDPECLEVAKKNAEAHEASIQLLAGDLLEPFLQKKCDSLPGVLLCNLPYVPGDFKINKAAKHEPSLALFGGLDGLDLFRRLFEQIDQLPSRPAVLTESLAQQHAALARIAQEHGYKQQSEVDLIQLFS